ncbi:MAG: response regulator [Sandaracinus sp.]|nr:response regulator [Sandaracinus sp.]
MGTEHGGAWLERAMRDVGFGAWRLDLRTGGIEVSEGLLELFGRTEFPERFEAFLELVHPDDRRALDRAVREAVATRAPYHSEFRVFDARSGELRWLEGRGRTSYEEKLPVAMLGTAVDVTERRLSQEALERSHAALAAHGRALTELARAPVWRTNDRDGAFRELSETAARTLGVERVGIWLFDESGAQLELVDLFERSRRAHSGGALFPRADAPTYFATIEEDRALAANDARTDPRTREFLSTYLEPLGIGALLDAPIHSHGRVVGIVCCEHVGGPRAWRPEDSSFVASLADYAALALDLAERAELEERLRRAQRLEGIGRLAGGVAHDFNNMLTAMLNGAVLVKRIVAPPAESDVAMLLDDIVEGARRAAGLTSQLLAFARRRPITPRIVDPREILVDMRPMLERVVGEGVHVELRLADDVGCVRMDPTQLEQVVLNLAVNARDAVSSDGRLEIELSHRTLDLEAASARPDLRPGPYTSLVVRDDGCGIPAEVLPKIFEPFFTTKPVGQGTGLGLATTWGLVRQAGGHIDVQSTPGVGTTFEVLLPRVDDRPHASPPAPPPVDDVHGDERILLVEDDDAVRRAVTEGLGSLGYRVHAVASAPEALAHVLTHEVDAVVTDVVMPTMGGPELALRLRERDPRLPIVYVTGHADDTTSVDDLGIPLVAKPFTSPELARTLRQLFAARTEFV